jgi:tetratricopeptide (TPR) repeat protein
MTGADTRPPTPEEQAEQQRINEELAAQARAAAQEKEQRDAQARAAHERILANDPPEKLYSYASRQEQARNYNGALDALRAIVERFPKNEFSPMAVQRMGVIQDKLDQAEFQQQQAVAREEDRSRQDQRFADHKQQQYDMCMSRYQSCTDQLDDLSGLAVDFAKDLFSGGNSNTLRRNQDIQNQQAQCEAIERECKAYR